MQSNIKNFNSIKLGVQLSNPVVKLLATRSHRREVKKASGMTYHYETHLTVGVYANENSSEPVEMIHQTVETEEFIEINQAIITVFEQLVATYIGTETEE